MFSIEVTDSGVRSRLEQLSIRVGNMRPIMQAIGEDIMARSKERFSTSTGPDGIRWKSNARSTIEAFLAKRSGFGKRGINKKGIALAISKKPLIGASGDLSRQFHVTADNSSVSVANSMVYAAMQQFGGKKSEFRNLWGDIPARPFLPITSSGNLYPAERASILDSLNKYFSNI